jgi:Polyketide cyclase / dehydrase and lipid transport
MGVASLRVRAAVPPERFVEALTDFGPRRSEVFGNSEGGYLEVHDRGDTWADVTEGSAVAGGVWQRYRYDWSEPGVVRLEVLDSNAFGKGSSWEYRVTPADGGSDIALTIRRTPTTLKGRVLDLALRLTGNRFVRKDLEKTVARLEGRGG